MSCHVVNRRVLFDALGYEPHEGQLRLHESTARIRVLACGARWGKTEAALVELLGMALEPGGDRLAWIVAPGFAVVDSLLSRLVATLNRGMPHRLIEWTASRHRLVVRDLGGTDVVIEGRSSEKPASLLGVSLDLLLVDEAGRIPDGVWDGALAQRLVDRGGRALVVGTPRNEGSWHHRLFMEGRAGSDDVASWRGPTTENPRIDPAVIERERERLTRTEFAQELLGQFVGPCGPVCDECGGPDPNGRAAIILAAAEEMGTCLGCDGPLDPDGRAAGRAEGAYLSLIVIRNDEPG